MQHSTSEPNTHCSIFPGDSTLKKSLQLKSHSAYYLRVQILSYAHRSNLQLFLRNDGKTVSSMVFGQFLLKYSESRNDWTSRSHSIELILLLNDPYFLASRHVIALPYHKNVAWVNFATNLDIFLTKNKRFRSFPTCHL
jgi:hypothetical protein